MNFKIKILIFGIFIISCNKNLVEKPSNLILEDEMVNILYDLAIVKSYSSGNTTINENDILKHVYFPDDYIFKKYQIDSTQLSQSNIYYSSRSDQQIRIFTKVLERLEAEKELIVKEKDSLNPKIKKEKPIKKSK